MNLLTPTGRRRSSLLIALTLLVIASAKAQTTAFTYQGKLVDSGNLANGSYDFQFKLFDAATVGTGTQQGSTVTVSNVVVSNGIFTVQLDFGVCASCFNGAMRFLEIAVKPISSGTFTTLGPRQPITSTPYAINAANAAQLGGLAASGYLQNSTSQQAASNFNISGNGTAGGTLTASIVNAVQQVNINGLRSFTVNGAYNDGTFIFAASNTFAGEGAGLNTTPSGTLNNINGKFNSFYGAGAGQANTTGSRNSFFGAPAGQQNTTGQDNAFFGTFAGSNNSGGSDNAFFGFLAGVSNTTGNNNIFFGVNAGSSNITGSGNTFIGGGANFNDSNISGNNLTLLGSSTLAFANVSNATAIGANAAVIQDNSLVLGSINGINGATADTNVGIGTPTPSERLHVVGNTVITGNVGIGTTAPRSALEVVRNWNGSFGALTVTGDRPTIRFSGGSPANNDQWILHLGSMAGAAPAGSLSFFFGGTAGTSYGNPVLSVTPNSTVIISTLGAAGSTSLCRNANNEIATCSSSLRYKTDVSAFSGGLDVVKKLRPIYFTWKQGGRRDVGFAAEEVAKVEPLFTFTNNKGEVEGVKYDRLSATFVNAFKEQQAQIEQQQRQLKERKHEAARQQYQLEQYRQQLASQQAQLSAQQSEIIALRQLLCRHYPKAVMCKAARSKTMPQLGR